MYEFAKLLDEAARGRKRVSRLYVNTFWEEKERERIEIEDVRVRAL